MRIPNHLIMVLGVIAVIAGCAQPAPKVDLAAERQAIEKVNQDYMAAVAARDTNAIVNLYAVDARFLPPNAPVAMGPDSIRALWVEFLRHPNLSLNISSSEITISAAGDLAVDVGTYHFSADPPTGHLDDVGKYVTAFKKVEGGWKIFADTFNSDRPAM